MRARPWYVIGLLVMALLAGCGSSTGGTKATPPSTAVPTATPVPHQLGLYLGTGKTLFALDPATGARRWKYDVTEPSANGGIYHVWVVDDTVFFAIGSTGWLYAISTSNGALRWKVHEGGSSADPFGATDQLVVASGVVYTASTATQVHASIYAINLASGQVLWQKDGHGTLAVDAHAVYVVAPRTYQGDFPANGVITALGLADGSTLWQAKDHPFDSQNWMVDGDTLYVTAEKLVYALDTHTGAIAWTKGFDGVLYTLIEGTHILYLTDEVTLYALDPATQKVLWQTPLANNGTMLYRNGNLFVAAFQQIYGVSAMNGRRLWSQSVTSSDVSMNDAAAFMRIGDLSGGTGGNLYAVTMATGKALWTSKAMPAIVGPTYATETSVFALTLSPATPGSGAVVQALSTTTGAIQWRFDGHSQYPGSLVVG